MQAQIQDVGPLQKSLQLLLDAAEVNGFIDRMIATYRNRYAMPGFRPGKAPDRVIQARFQEDIERAVISELVPDAIRRAFAENDIHPASPPEVSGIRYRPGEPLTFELRVHVWPQVELRPYEGVEIEHAVEPVRAEEVEAFLEGMMDRNAERVAVDRPAGAGDLIGAELETIDAAGARVKGTKKEKVTIEVGADHLLPEFREASLGMSAGESRELEVRYPDSYGDRRLEGQTRRYRLTAMRIEEKKRQPLDDEFARRLDANLDLDGLRARVRLRLESERRMAARERLEERLVDRLIQDNPFELPQVSVANALARIAEKLREEGKPADPEQIASAYRPHVERFQRRDFLLEKVGEREGIRVTPEEVDAEIARMAREERRPAEEVRADIGDVDRFQQFLFERRIFAALLEKVTVRETPTIEVPAG
ncbi:MAG: trigger factor [Candidatus Eisenbacteria bacterium]|uniref:Trigger factor n=1 Tax=Eiseniibacteriota bacterium TaxID=2212470 RepID=A0A938BQ65_UNCEI|nr:trigger factor [Candidatus Eisenbacteria bacterium]